MISANERRAFGRSVVLCLDAEAVRHPEAVGLEGEELGAQSWLKVISSGVEARNYLNTVDASSDVWVVSSDDIDPINLAAAIKRDHCDRSVSLVAFEGTGSLRSRARYAGIDAVMGRSDFALGYRNAKQANVRAGAQLEAVPRVADCAPVHEPSSKTFAASAEGSPSLAQSAFLMPVVSGSGGSGKSTVAVLAALVSSQIGYRTVLVDLDLQFGDVLSLVGRDDALRVDEALESPALLSRLRQEGQAALSVIGAPRRLERAETIAANVPRLVDALGSMFDVIVANTGSLWGEHHAAMLERSAKSLFLVDQRPSSLRACQHALELCARCGIATSPFLFAVNRCSRGALYTSIDVSCALRGAQTVELADGGTDVEEALAAGRPGDLIHDGNELCESIRDVLEGVLPGCAERLAAAEAAAPRLRGLFGRRRGRGRSACR